MFNMKRTNAIKFLINLEGQATVLFSVLLLLVIVVGLTVVQLGQGVERRIRFRQVADSVCMAQAAAYSSQTLPVSQLSLAHEYILLAHCIENTLKIFRDAANVVETASEGHDPVSILFSSSSYHTKFSSYHGKMQTITDNFEDPGLIPETFEKDTRSILLRNAMLAGDHILNMNKPSHQAFTQMEQVVVPDTFLWSNNPLDHPVSGFFQISNMPSPHFFFSNVYPYAHIGRRGRMINATYIHLYHSSATETINNEALKEEFENISLALKSINETNQQRIEDMNALLPATEPEDFASLIVLWETLLEDYRTWAQDALDAELFHEQVSMETSVVHPAFSSWKNAIGNELTRDNSFFLDLASQKGISSADEEQMINDLSSMLTMMDLFYQGNIELTIDEFNIRLLDYYDDLMSATAIDASDLQHVHGKLKAFDPHHANENNISMMLRLVAEAMENELDETSIQVVNPMNLFLHSFSEAIKFFYHQLTVCVADWALITQSPADPFEQPSAEFFEHAVDFFYIPIIRLESH